MSTELITRKSFGRAHTYPINDFIRDLFDDGDHIAYKTALLQYFCADLDRDETRDNVRDLSSRNFDEFTQPHELQHILRGLNYIISQYLLLSPENYGNLLATLLALFYNTMDPALHQKMVKVDPQLNYNLFLRGHEDNGVAIASIVDKMKTLCRREQTESSTEILELLDNTPEHMFDALVKMVAETRQELFQQRDLAFVPEAYIKQDCTQDGLIHFLWDNLARFWETVAMSSQAGNIIDTWESMLQFNGTGFDYRFPDLILFHPSNSSLTADELMKRPTELHNDVFQPTGDGNIEWNNLSEASGQVVLMYLCLANLTTTAHAGQFMKVLYQSKNPEFRFSKHFIHEWTRPLNMSLSDEIEANCHLSDGGKSIPGICWKKIEEAQMVTFAGDEPLVFELDRVMDDPHLFHARAKKPLVEEGSIQEAYIRDKDPITKEPSTIIPLVVGVCAASVAFYVFRE